MGDDDDDDDGIEYIGTSYRPQPVAVAVTSFTTVNYQDLAHPVSPHTSRAKSTVASPSTAGVKRERDIDVERDAGAIPKRFKHVHLPVNLSAPREVIEIPDSEDEPEIIELLDSDEEVPPRQPSPPVPPHLSHVHPSRRANIPPPIKPPPPLRSPLPFDNPDEIVRASSSSTIVDDEPKIVQVQRPANIPALGVRKQPRLELLETFGRLSLEDGLAGRSNPEGCRSKVFSSKGLRVVSSIQLVLGATTSRRLRGLQLPRPPDRSSRSMHLQLHKHISESAGAMVYIAQSRGDIAIASSVPDGDADEEDHVPNLDPGNRAGTLVAYSSTNGTVQSLNRHCRKVYVGHEGAKARKFYSVTDVAFNPTCTDFLSSGNDGYIRGWRKEGDEYIYANRYDRPGRTLVTPVSLLFKESDSLVAIGWSDGQLQLSRVANDAPSGDPRPLFVSKHFINLTSASNNSGTVGAMAWRPGPVREIFASTEGEGIAALGHRHVAVNARTGQQSLFSSTTEVGDNLAVHPDGDLVALITKDEAHDLHLRLHDLRRKPDQPTSVIQLLPFDGHVDPFDIETNTAAFSPDGTFLSVGRIDNQIEVWDMRFLTNRQSLRHGPSQGIYGIARDLCWVTGQHGFGVNMGLVSGGADGCVRLWDMQLSNQTTEDSIVLAETRADIGALSVGKPWMGEWRLVVGDNLGDVHIFK